MPVRGYRFAVVLSLLCFLIASVALAEQVLVKIDSNDVEKLPGSVTEDYIPRFYGESFVLLQGDEDQFIGLSPSCIVLDKIKPHAVYYLVRVGRTGDYLPQLEQFGHIILKFGDSALLRINPSDEPLLIGLGLQFAPLPESIRLYPQRKNLMAPRLKLPAEAAAMVGDIVNAVSADELRNSVYELQENRDLDPPHTAYRSRFCLRVAETDDPSDDACDNAAEYIYNKFEKLGLDVEYDTFLHKVLTQGQYQMRNVVATLPGKGLNSQRTYLITAHYDSTALRATNWFLAWKTMSAPGADDNASGTAGVLEAARILSEYDFNCTIKFIAFSGEELGLHGSAHYAALAAESGEDIAGVINLDMIAYDPDELDVDLVANINSEWLVEAMRAIQREYSIGPLILRKIVDRNIWYSDHFSFWNKGWDAVLSIDNSDLESSEFYPKIHTTEDTIENLNFDMASRMVQVVVGTAASLADPIGGTPHPDLAVADEDVHIFPENPGLGQTIQVTASIHNVGEVDAENVRIQVLIVEPFSETPDPVYEKNVDVQVGESVQISTSLKLTEWGDYRVLVRANPDYQIFETNGGNNTASKAIRIDSELPTFGELMLYPNPFYPDRDGKVNIAYSLSRDTSARLAIHNALGKLVYQKYFTSGENPGGKFGANDGIEWDGTNSSGEKASSGIYFCHVSADGAPKVVSRKLIIIR